MKISKRTQNVRGSAMRIPLARSPRRWGHSLTMTGLSMFGLVIIAMSAPLWALDSSITQLAVSIASSWDATSGKLQLFEREGATWRPASAPFHVLYGKSGLAWGRGALGTNEPGPQKTERDKRAPAGVFKIGKIYTYDPALPDGARYPFYTITGADAWIDDPNLPHYNQHVVVDPANPPPWFEKQKMRLNDPPHRWLIEIRHNADPPVPNAGSAIFFHIQRGPNRASTGCTVMPEASIVRIIRWLRKEKNPYYVLLPRDEYLRRWKAWGLPSPEAAEGLLGPLNKGTAP
jgi:L,D-peptidoglycan transpeptidase YkuD (ErfK/YbiS/YcfS/YnhG family)